MKIALDFDKTFTVDPQFWAGFLGYASDFGHEVRIVTARDEHNDGIEWTKLRIAGYYWPPCPVIWCDGRPKRQVCREAGWEPDVWIDDNPASIILATAFTDEESLAAWRRTDEYRGSKQPIHGRSRGFEGREEPNDKAGRIPGRTGGAGSGETKDGNGPSTRGPLRKLIRAAERRENPQGNAGHHGSD